MPPNIDIYYEPFLGGGALWLALQPRFYSVNDSNGELMNVYTAIRDDVDSVIATLYTFSNDEAFYYKVRAWDKLPMFGKLSPAQRAARFLYINKTGFNGLYRVNQGGTCNVPYGRHKNPDWINEEGLRALSQYLRTTQGGIRSEHFRVDHFPFAKENDFVYLDPPYDTDGGNFTAYTEGGFGRDKHLELRGLCSQLDLSGARFMMSNADTSFIRDLYAVFHIETVQARRNINRDGGGRGKVNELIIRNY